MSDKIKKSRKQEVTIPCCRKNMGYANYNSVVALLPIFAQKFRDFLIFFPENLVV
jgi:hypothetical protein